MRAEVIGIGTEILLGQIANTNAQWISERLAAIGVDVPFHQAVGDNLERIESAFRLACSRADLVIATGGLGPTQDDITREGLAAALGVPLERRPELEAGLRAKFAARRREMPESNLRQCDVPRGGAAIEPIRGTAPGLACRTADGVLVYAVPGVPAEMREMMEGTILPAVAALTDGSVIVSRVLKVTGVSEATIGEVLDDLFHGSTNPTVAYLAGGGEVRVRLTAKARDEAAANRLIDPVAVEVARRFEGYVYSDAGEDLEVVVGRLLEAAGRTVACAESLTGGGLGARLSRTPGASRYFLGSAVCYTAESKRAVLGVSAATLDGPGVVSEACALEMARGARRLYGADYGLGLTGAAGPEPHGGAAPGTVCLAICSEDSEVARTLLAPGDRAAVRRWAEQVALDLLRRRLSGLPIPERVGLSTRVGGG